MCVRVCVGPSRCSSGFRLGVWWNCSLGSTCHTAFTRAGLGRNRILRFHARSSRSVFNLLTVKLISHPITQQLTPNWLLSFSHGWACTWIYCRCAKVHVHYDYVISKGKGVCTCRDFVHICTKFQKICACVLFLNLDFAELEVKDNGVKTQRRELKTVK